MTNHSTMQLGKRPQRRDARTLKLARYMTGALPPAPVAVDYTHGVADWGMMLNDRLGDCTIADGPGHATQVWTLNATGTMVTPPDAAVLDAYKQWCGYNPADPSTDQGGVELDVLNHWRQQGFNGHALDAFVAIELGARDSGFGTRGSGLGVRDRTGGTRDWEHGAGDAGTRAGDSRFKIQDSRIAGSQSRRHSDQCRGESAQSTGSNIQSAEPDAQTPTTLPDILTAIWLFGGAYIGVELPITAQTQDVWDVPQTPGRHDEPGSWGGHALYLVGYDFGSAELGLTSSESGNGGTGNQPAGDSRFKIQDSRIPGVRTESQDTRNEPAGDSRFKIQDSRIPGVRTESQDTRNERAGDSGFKIQDSRSLSAAQSDSGNLKLTLTCITWGKRKKMTWAWFEKYCSEAYALVSRDWLNASGISPSGFDLAALESDLKLVTG